MRTTAGEPVSVAGVVRALENTPRGMRALVAVAGGSGCPRCAEGRGCGAGLLGRRRDRCIEVPVPPGASLVAGQGVNVYLDGPSLFGAAAVVYGLPLAGAVLASVLAGSAGLADGGTALAALAGVALGLCVARYRLCRPGGTAEPRLGP
ncbi:MAG TPA: SoxR reducing system RseC family protein [Woeseiaceae bacterium]|nr:SoxR reducing system RseC family protein [Woeseiaceae bacterium]